MTGWVMKEHGVPDSRLKVICINGCSNDSHITWLCECSCEAHNKIVATGKDIRNGSIKSCGCLRKEVARINAKIGRPLAANAASLANKKYNQIELNLKDEHGLYGIGYCTNTNSKFYFDMDDYDKIKCYTWMEHIDDKDYHALEAWDKNKNKNIRMHWIIVGKYYDHIDRNPLNNRRYNLRESTFVQNTQNRGRRSDNTSGVVGVCWNKREQKWQARINVNKKRILLGRYNDFNNAVVSRLKAEKEYFGEFAPQKHLFEQYNII